MFGKKAPLNDLAGDKLSDGLGAVSHPEDKIIEEISVHKMPKDYKSGSFSYDEYFGAVKKTVATPPNNLTPVAKTQVAPSPVVAATTAPTGKPTAIKSDAGKTAPKKMGIFIMIGAIVAILALAYFLISYLSPNFFNFGASKTVVPAVKNPNVISSSTNNVSGNNNLTPTSTEVISTSTIEVATSTATSSPVVTPATSTVSTPSGLTLFDSDLDGLNDQEELALGLDINKTDTDGDGYNDLAELSGLYNPSGAGKIDQDANLVKYTNPVYKYSVLYPKLWKKESVDKDSAIIFTADDNSFIQVVAQANDKKQNIKDWYEAEFLQVVAANQMIKVAGVDAVSSLDGLNIYFTDKASKNIYVISYTPIVANNLAFREILEMILGTFTF